MSWCRQRISTIANGFTLPGAPEGSLAAWAYEADAIQTGDQFRIEATAVSDGVNPADNFWNESRTASG